ncbi:hypothetical protein C8J56DRAFT_888920 [Mycena floridula]|nr:hypothetical protein C8J56DRAFT_888920 [Mycena floridula]
MPKVIPNKNKLQAALTATRRSPRKRVAAVDETPATPKRQSQANFSLSAANRTIPATPESPTLRPAKLACKRKMTVVNSDEEELGEQSPAMLAPSSLPAPWTLISSPTVVAPVSSPMPKIMATKKNQWASTNNVLYGHVENANVGKLPYRLPRKRPLRENVQYSNGKSASRFKILMGDVIMRAEKASHETGGWIYVVAHKQVVNMVHSCKVAHRKTAQNLSTELMAREEELAEARRMNAAQAAELKELRQAAAALAGPDEL